MTSSDMKMPLKASPANEKGDKVLEIDAKLWNKRMLPNTVTPNFSTCNLARTYSLDIKVGLSWGDGKIINVCSISPAYSTRCQLSNNAK